MKFVSMVKKLRSKSESGSVIVNILIITLFLSVIIMALVVLANSSLSRAKGRILLLEAQYAAESGADTAIAYLNSDPNSTYTGTDGSQVTVLNNSLYKATYETTVAAGSSGSQKIVTSTGRLFQPKTAATAKFSRKIEVTVERTPGTLAATGMLSRNIIEIASSVKDIYAKDIYVNGYLQTDKNTNYLHVENLTAAGKNTSASNCSISGPGNLVKPTTFVTPGQTKTKITVAFNNCISPPGNTSNANFDVFANQTNIAKIQSTYLPWSQFMDASYKDGSCSDWTTGSSPRRIPSTGNNKKTHYPDSSSNISTSCGSSGDLALGSNQYDITDNTHVRANLCAASACNPTFNNPDSTPKYIFVEGTINFTGVASAPGSGPVVLVSYGADPASKASDCPLGGAVYLGSSGSNNVNAPQIYFIANNGLCFDKTKFGGTPSFGGISGKNIFISTNSGNPFDPTLNTDFPLSTVPIDLSWHASRYRRL